MDIYWHSWNNGWKWHKTRYAHYISLGYLQINIRRRAKRPSRTE